MLSKEEREEREYIEYKKKLKSSLIRIERDKLRFIAEFVKNGIEKPIDYKIHHIDEIWMQSELDDDK
jgi:hypothetical protein